MKVDELINVARQHLNSLDDVIHNDSHMIKVLEYSKEIARAYPETDLDILTLAVWWHDVGRIESEDNHPEISARMASKQLRDESIGSHIINKVIDAIANHSSEKTPKYIEGKILHDADKLDLLTPVRWQLAIDHKKDRAIEYAMARIPHIRNEILILEESRNLYDKLIVELKEYFKTIDNKFFDQYKKGSLDICH